MIVQVVNERKKSAFEKDLLQMVIENVKDDNLSKEDIDSFIVDNCKNIYLAGYETTAVSATWCLMLLASNQDWQDRVRAEVLEICGGRIPDLSMLGKMKQVRILRQHTLQKQVIYTSGFNLPDDLYIYLRETVEKTKETYYCIMSK